MSEIHKAISASGTLPNNYQEVLSWKVTGKPMRVIAMNILGTLFVLSMWLLQGT